MLFMGLHVFTEVIGAMMIVAESLASDDGLRAQGVRDAIRKRESVKPKQFMFGQLNHKMRGDRGERQSVGSSLHVLLDGADEPFNLTNMLVTGSCVQQDANPSEIASQAIKGSIHEQMTETEVAMMKNCSSGLERFKNSGLVLIQQCLQAAKLQALRDQNEKWDAIDLHGVHAQCHVLLSLDELLWCFNAV